jgi:DNA-binding NarL/FixJ family response regulator
MEPEKLIKVLCVEDSEDLATLLRMMIDAEPDMSAVGCLHSADCLVEEVLRSKPDIVLLDLTMPGKDPVQALSELQRCRPETRVIVFSGFDSQDRVNQAVEAGAWGYISKHQEMPEVLSAIRRVAGGEFVLTT